MEVLFKNINFGNLIGSMPLCNLDCGKLIYGFNVDLVVVELKRTENDSIGEGLKKRGFQIFHLPILGKEIALCLSLMEPKEKINLHKTIE